MRGSVRCVATVVVLVLVTTASMALERSSKGAVDEQLRTQFEGIDKDVSVLKESSATRLDAQDNTPMRSSIASSR